MNKDDKLNVFLFMFSMMAFLYSFFTIKTFINEYGDHVSSIPIAVVICPFICMMCLFKMMKSYKPLSEYNKKELRKKIKSTIMNKYHEGIELTNEWRTRKNYKH